MNAYLIEQLSYVSPNGFQPVRDVSFELPVGSKAVILGSNGSGKSTLLRHMSGAIVPQQGNVTVLGRMVDRKNRKILAKSVKLIEHKFKQPFFSHDAWDYVTSQLLRKSIPKAEIIDRSRLALSAVDMFRDRQTALSDLNIVQLKKVSIAVALVNNPDILLLDEPISGMDPQSYSEMFSLLQALHLMGKTIVVATHDVDFAAAWAESVIVLGEGTVLAKGNSSLTIDPDLMKKAKLRVPIISMPFTLIPEWGEIPRTLQEAMVMLWKLRN